MPIYEYRCNECARISSVMQAASGRLRRVECDHCGSEARAIISRTNARLSLTSKVDKLDPKYDKLVDQAMKNTSGADPDVYLKRMNTPKDSN